jgi:hypothetical protein
MRAFPTDAGNLGVEHTARDAPRLGCGHGLGLHDIQGNGGMKALLAIALAILTTVPAMAADSRDRRGWHYVCGDGYDYWRIRLAK